MKAAEKEGLTSVIIKKVEDSLSCELPFYDALVLYEKIRGWKSLLQFRGECFWLESDFQNY